MSRSASTPRGELNLDGGAVVSSYSSFDASSWRWSASPPVMGRVVLSLPGESFMVGDYPVELRGEVEAMVCP